MQDMELFSTVLWQLRREVDMCYLAQSAVALDRLDPRTWCIMGNCFSLQKVCQTYFLPTRVSSLTL